MRINNLELTDFRNYNHFFIEFDQGINILIGGNAQGKTNIIEAIYLLSVCKSFRTHINDQMIRFDHDFAKVKGNVFSNERMHQLELILSKESKKAKVDGKDILKISDYVGYLNAVVFVPDDLSLVKGSPSIRRKFLDLELSKISPIYVFYLTKYNRLLKERNQYLKLLNQRRGKYDEYLETLDEQLAEVQIKIIEKRNNFIERLSLKVKDIYLNIANCHEIVELRYECFIKDVNKEDILKQHLVKLIQEWGTEFEQSKNPNFVESLFGHYLKYAETYQLLYKCGLSYLVLDTIKSVCGPKPEQENIQAYTNAWLACGLFGWIDEWIIRGM